MSQRTICDVCLSPIHENDLHGMDHNKISINGEDKDICQICFVSPIILSEMRRTRTRKAKAEKPVPKRGRKTKVTETPSN